MGKSDKASYITAWQKQAVKLEDAVTDADMSLPVHGCPDWSLADLVHHVADVYTFVMQQAGSAEPVAHEPISMDGEPLAVLARNEHALAQTFHRLQLDDPAWNPWPAPKTVRSWLTRVQNDTAIHAWDAQRAVDRPEPIDTVVAVDGVTEFLGALLPVSWRSDGHSGGTGVVRFVAEDVGKHWRLRIRGSLVALLDENSGGEDDTASVSGTASDLLLALWGRLPYDELQLSGDTQLARHVRNTGLFGLQ